MIERKQKIALVNVVEKRAHHSKKSFKAIINRDSGGFFYARQAVLDR
jgi:hypothetical protein